MRKLLSQLGSHIGVCLLLLGLVAVSGCNSEYEVSSVGEGFGLQTHGSPLPHSPTYVSLLRTNDSGKWITVWQAISFRFKSIAVSNKAIVFGGVTDRVQTKKGLVRFLYFSESTGVVDLTDSLFEKANGTKKMQVGLIRVKQTGSSIKVELMPNVGDGDLSVEVSFEQLAEMARTVVGRNKKGTFDGISFFE